MSVVSTPQVEQLTAAQREGARRREARSEEGREARPGQPARVG